MKLTLLATTVVLAAATLASSAPAEAKGCLKGALVGGVAGHYAGQITRFSVAIGGCVVGHHMANEKQRDNSAAAQTQHPDPQSNGQ